MPEGDESGVGSGKIPADPPVGQHDGGFVKPLAPAGVGILDEAGERRAVRGWIRRVLVRVRKYLFQPRLDHLVTCVRKGFCQKEAEFFWSFFAWATSFWAALRSFPMDRHNAFADSGWSW